MPTGRLVDGIRNRGYGEVLLAFAGPPLRVEVDNSFLLNECPDQLWRALDATALARENEASVAILNGPRFWLMDGIAKVDGTLDRVAYTVRHAIRGAAWYFDAGSDVHELVTDRGEVFVVQAYCVGVDTTLTLESLRDLDRRLELPDGWIYRTRSLSDELVIDTTVGVASVLPDELENTYCLSS